MVHTKPGVSDLGSSHPGALTKEQTENEKVDSEGQSNFTWMQRRIQSSTGPRGKRVAGQKMGRTSSDFKGEQYSGLGSKKEHIILRRSDNEYFSSLQTNASHAKFQQELDATSSSKTYEQRQKDLKTEQVNLRTELGKQNRAEQVLASGFFSQPKQQVRNRPETAHVSKRHQIVGTVHQFYETRNIQEQQLAQTREQTIPSRIRHHSTLNTQCGSEKPVFYDPIKTDLTRMKAEKEKEENRVTEKF